MQLIDINRSCKRYMWSCFSTLDYGQPPCNCSSLNGAITMKRFFILGAIALTLSGCETTPVQELTYTQKKALVDKIIASCIKQGVSLKSREMTVCTNSEIDREIALRAKNRAVAAEIPAMVGRGLSGYANSAARNNNTTSTCTTTPYSTFVGGRPSSYTTRCY